MRERVERRSARDRRQRRLHSVLYQFFRQRRHGERRAGYRGVHHYVDVYGPGLLVVVLLILVLCIADSYLTLTLLHHGGQELNPVMRLLVEHDVRWFFYGKYALTACSLIVLLLHKNAFLVGAFSGTHVLLVVLLGYALLISYQLRLVTTAGLPLFA